MKTIYLENGFTKFECTYCGAHLIHHTSEGIMDAIEYAREHEDKCVFNPNCHACPTCKYYDDYGNCSITKTFVLPFVEINMPCWQPVVPVWQRIKLLLTRNR